MKFIHCADVHLGSSFCGNFGALEAEERKRELRATFTAMTEYARREGINRILIAGDLFDSDRPLKRDKEFFFSVVRNNADIDFLYLRGNHDGRESYEETLPNLKKFTNEWTAYKYGDVTVWGAELGEGDARPLLDGFFADSAAKNIVMLHGTAGDSDGKDAINLSRLRGKNIDYLALGHIHSFTGVKRLDDRGVYAYSGCLEGRGFDEAGDKGFIVVDTDGFKIKFVPFARRAVRVYAVDITGARDDYAAYRTVKSQIDCKKDDLVRVILRGETAIGGAGLADELGKRLEGDYYAVSVKDETVTRRDISAIREELSVRGEFVRAVMSDERYSEDTKNAIIAAGLDALEGREI